MELYIEYMYLPEDYICVERCEDAPLSLSLPSLGSFGKGFCSEIPQNLRSANFLHCIILMYAWHGQNHQISKTYSGDQFAKFYNACQCFLLYGSMLHRI